MTKQKESSLLMRGPLVRATIEGRKTNTRRIITIPESACIGVDDILKDPDYYVRCGWCPYGKPGDRIWVRETFNTREDGTWFYRADEDQGAGVPWTPAIHMPRIACRLVLEIESITVERVQAISDADILAEGITKELFQDLVWNRAAKLNTKTEYWISEGDEGLSYCRTCAEKAIKELLKENPSGGYHLGGGYCSEGDSIAECEGCGVTLDNSLTDYGCEAELEHYIEYGLNLKSRYDCHAAYTVAESASWIPYTTDHMDHHVASRSRRRAELFHKVAWITLWDSIYDTKKGCMKGHSWDQNPAVWVIKYKKL